MVVPKSIAIPLAFLHFSISSQMERLAKRLKKENVHVDIVSFGEEEANGEKLSLFVDTLNGKEQKEGKNKLVIFTYNTNELCTVTFDFGLVAYMCTEPINYIYRC